MNAVPPAGHFDAQGIVMAVRTTPYTNSTGVEVQVQILFTKQVNARIHKNRQRSFASPAASHNRVFLLSQKEQFGTHASGVLCGCTRAGVLLHAGGAYRS